MLVDDHDMVRHGLTVLLEAFDDFEVVGQTNDGQMALTLCHACQPDIVLMDLLMPHMDGVAATWLIHDKFPNIRIVALTSSTDEILVDAALKAGATSYILKTGSIDEVAEAVRAAYHGKSTLAPEAVDALVLTLRQPKVTGDDLTRRQREILSLMIEGLHNIQIAKRLVISTSTVKNHVASIFVKLGVKSCTQAIALAVRQNILDKPV